ncbi:enoyl-CoA hydratase-related protein [Marivita geojedonensis]|uniref:enoyl-CoA hydratase-related protein n=1 Tax=Marivita geojedonensis TaxID=1123756 RepID=UPI000A1FB3FC|nr:enoyl-CoA hydratase-related protein [Marivita geojedonensis]PRY73328.1 3-hydroxyacyl-CoA dehydrogenase [Marivita geojedonensis]
MGRGTDISVEDGVAQIALDAGPGARLTHAGLVALDMALARIAAQDDVRLIVIRGQGPVFPSGITDPLGGGDDRDNLLADLCLRMEQCPKPVVAVLSGAVVGAGVELALAAHYRLIHKNTRIGFPNARLGVVPSAGATQRLPRLVGGEMALEMLLGGALLPITHGKLSLLADDLFDGSADDAIAAFAGRVPLTDIPPRPTAARRDGFADARAYQAAINLARTKAEVSPEVAPKHILAAVEAALVLPIEASLGFEQAAHEDCAKTDQARALSHLFHAEQAVGALVRRSDLPEMSTILVLGGSPIAVQITLAALDAGVTVNWAFKDAEQERGSVAQVRAAVEEAVRAGRYSAERAARSQKLLRHGTPEVMIAGADIALRATRGQRGAPIPPDMPVAHCLPGTDPHLTLHFAPPASRSRLVEVILGPDSSEAHRLAGLALARRMHKLAVVQTTSGPGLHDRLIQTFLRAADALVDLGQSPFAIDAALRDWGMAHPPFELADSLGFSVGAAHARADGAQNWSERLLQTGRQGRANGRGFYRHTEGAAAEPDPEVLNQINQARAPQSDMPADRIVRCVLGAMANEGAKALREGVVPRAGDIDVVSVFSHLVPNWRGGVMHAAGEGGLLATQRAMQSLDHPDRELWTPDPVFAELIKYGRTFDDL